MPTIPPRLPHATLLAALLLTACNTPYHPPLLPAPAQFPGLIDLAAQSGDGEADVLLVHGICTHDASWADTVIAQLTRALSNATSSARPADRSAPIEIVASTVTTPAGRLRFNALIWSPLTSPLKRQLCGDQTSKSSLCLGTPPYPYQRGRLNARFKDGLIDDCLPDALIYQGVARNAIQRHMRDAILRTVPANRPLIVIAHSMGSKILFDTLLGMRQEPAASPAAAVAQQTMDRLRLLVMAANQIPLLALADQPLPDSLQQLLRQPRAAAGHHLTMIAFTDPNDLLSYPLDAAKYAQDGITVYNILVSNAPTWLGLLERPDRAHLDYLDNPDVARLIACGQPTSKLCI